MVITSSLLLSVLVYFSSSSLCVVSTLCWVVYMLALAGWLAGLESRAVHRGCGWLVLNLDGDGNRQWAMGTGWLGCPGWVGLAGLARETGPLLLVRCIGTDRRRLGSRSPQL